MLTKAHDIYSGLGEEAKLVTPAAQHDDIFDDGSDEHQTDSGDITTAADTASGVAKKASDTSSGKSEQSGSDGKLETIDEADDEEPDPTSINEPSGAFDSD